MKIPTLLHVEDDENDRTLLKFAHERAQLPINIIAVEDGEQAINYLTGEGPYLDSVSFPQPALVLLDLKMPLRDGFEVLEWIRNQDRFRELPVIIMSSSGHECDRQRAFRNGASSYLVKPTSFESLVGMVRQIYFLWLDGSIAASDSFYDDATRGLPLLIEENAPLDVLLAQRRHKKAASVYERSRPVLV